MQRPMSPRCQAALIAQQAASDAATQAALANQQAAFDVELNTLSTENDTLSAENDTLSAENNDLNTENNELSTQLGLATDVIETLTTQHALDVQTIADLRALLAELQAPGTLFGAFEGPDTYPNVDPVESKAMMRTRVNSLLGGRLGVERIFNESSFAVPAAGVPAVVSFALDPVAVAAGSFDAQLITFVNALDINTPYWLVLNHECDQATRNYTPAEQVAGFRRFSTVVRSVSKPKVKVTMILMSWTLTQGADRWRDWYPGPEYVDTLGWDAYWRPAAARTAATVYGPAWEVTQAEGKEFLIGETSLGAQGHGGHELVGGVYVPIAEDEWTTFATDAIAYLDGKAAAVMWFYTNKSDGDWRLTPHPAALDIWKSAVIGSLD